jgi:hypothetical protein
MTNTTWNASTIHEALSAANLPVCGVAVLATPHDTQFGATFVRSGKQLVRIDWQRRPSDEERNRALDIVADSSDKNDEPLQAVDSPTNTYPADQPEQLPQKISDVTAFYRHPLAWFGSAPNIDHNVQDLTCLFDEVYRAKLKSGIQIRVLRVGIFVFDFSKSNLRTSSQSVQSSFDTIADLNITRLSVLNTYLLCLSSTITSRHNITEEKQILRLTDLLHSKTFENPENIYFNSNRDDNLPNYHELTADYFRNVYGGAMFRRNAIIKWQYGFRRTISEQDIQEAANLFDEILELPTEVGVVLVSLLAQSYEACEDFNFSLALIIAWSITEKLLSILWERHVDTIKAERIIVNTAKVSRVNATRLERLKKDTRTFSAAVISEILELQNILPHELYVKSTVVRKARNEWLHSLRKVPSMEETIEALTLATAMLKLVLGISLALAPKSSLSIHIGA